VGAHEFRNHFGLYMERAANGSEILIRRRGRPTHAWAHRVSTECPALPMCEG